MDKRLLILFCLVLTGCHEARENSQSTAGQTPAQPTSTETPRQSAPPPTDAELRAVLKRIYAEVVTVDDTRTTPFLIGDFNGDRSEDIAIVVKPRKLSEVNGEYVNWILEDLRKPQQISRDVRANDILLAVIHGREREGWRHDLAIQTYLLKNAVGTDVTTQPANQLKTSGESKALSQLRGDVIREKLNGSGGVIYWNGAKYAWLPVSL